MDLPTPDNFMVLLHDRLWWFFLVGSVTHLICIEQVIRTGRATKDSLILRAISALCVAGMLPFGTSPLYFMMAIPVGFFSFSAALNAETEDES